MSKKLNVILFSLVSIVCLVFVAVLCVNFNTNNNSVKNDNLIVDVQDNDNIKLSKRLLSNTATASSGYVITASVGPSVAADKSLTWNLAWADSYDESVSNYVTMEISADTFVVTLTYVKNFSHQLVLTASSVSNPSVSATCTIDCYKRIDNYEITNVQASYNGTFVDVVIDNVSKTINFNHLFDNAFELEHPFSEIFIYNITPTTTYTGTINVEMDERHYITLSDELISILNENGLSYNSTTTISINDLEKYTLYSLLCSFITDLDTASLDAFAELVNLIKANDCWFYLHSNYECLNVPDYMDMSYTYKLVGFQGLFYTNVMSIYLNESSIVM